MRHLELHIIQSVPVSCLNRDDLNSPKTAVFGGVQRARVSSQSWKRAIREMAEKEFDKSGQFKGKRSRLFIEKISAILQGQHKVAKDTANALSLCAGHYLAKLDSKQEGKVKTLVFLSPLEYELFANTLYSLEESKKKELLDAVSRVDKEKLAKDDDGDDDTEEEEVDNKKKSEKKLTVKKFTELVTKILKAPIKKAFKGEKETQSLPKDAADIALFGRMVANDHSLTVEAASMFSHALSTHKADNEIDFFAAVDDLQPKEESGAGMTGTLEFNSATYYRFAALNLDMLADADHLKSMTIDERKDVVRTFLEATIKAVPTARKNGANANTVSDYVLGIVREKGHPVQVVNAFESPVRPSIKGFVVESINRMNDEYADLKDTWGINSVFAKAVVKKTLTDQVKEKLGSIETCSLDDLIDGMVKHVI